MVPAERPTVPPARQQIAGLFATKSSMFSGTERLVDGIFLKSSRGKGLNQIEINRGISRGDMSRQVSSTVQGDSTIQRSAVRMLSRRKFA